MLALYKNSSHFKALNNALRSLELSAGLTLRELYDTGVTL
ncbi:hypothetical protein PMAN_b0734 [Pseudoalteromonas marina]|nr:hypothetical protein PMAN_b0734 [Pseudoalteromonas marina]GAA76569.1 hypothetical protein P20480_3051 [Pseudoalteromonas sp. BSi20480]